MSLVSSLQKDRNRRGKSENVMVLAMITIITRAPHTVVQSREKRWNPRFRFR